MLITRTPLRISIGGGGTDLASYYSRHGGFVISAAIDRHVYIAVNRTFTDDYFLKYSALERVKQIDEIDHPIIRDRAPAAPDRPVARDRQRRRHPCRDGARLLRDVHGGPSAGIARLQARTGDPGRPRRGGVPHRDRPPRPAGRKAGPVHRVVRRDHVLRDRAGRPRARVAAQHQHAHAARSRGASADVLHGVLAARGGAARRSAATDRGGRRGHDRRAPRRRGGRRPDPDRARGR